MGQSVETEKILIITTALLLVLVAFLSISIYTAMKEKRLEKKYREFMRGTSGTSFESALAARFKEIDVLKEETKYMSEKVDVICDALTDSFQKVGLVKYDAFSDVSGKLSFSLCLLDDNNNGFILSVVHTRDGCYTYTKEIIKGESFTILSKEEIQSLEEAKTKRNFMNE